MVIKNNITEYESIHKYLINLDEDCLYPCKKGKIIQDKLFELAIEIDNFREWKNKVTPFLSEYLLMLADSLTYETSEYLPDNYRLLKEQHTILTELLKD